MKRQKSKCSVGLNDYGNIEYENKNPPSKCYNKQFNVRCVLCFVVVGLLFSVVVYAWLVYTTFHTVSDQSIQKKSKQVI
jgi:hypothetical protein